MKKMHHIILLLLLCSVTAVMGQDYQEVPRRTPQEQAAFESTVPVNPAKLLPGQLMDPKMDPAQTVEPPVRWKAEEAPVERGKSPVDMPEEIRPDRARGAQPATTTQPEAQKSPGDPFPYRNVRGSAGQAPDNGTGTAFPYRDQKGSADQPDPRKSPK